MADPGPGASDRLDSWKAIAAHLGRDVRTVRRWEVKRGLPVRRVPGGQGQSVFAYASEIDAWLTATPLPEQLGPDRGDGHAEGRAYPSRRRWLWGIATSAALLVGAAGAAWGVHRLPPDWRALTFQARAGAVVARGSAGDEQWRYSLPADEAVGGIVSHEGGPVTVLEKGGGFILGIGRTDVRSASMLPSQLLWFTPTGALAKTFSFEKRVRFGSADYADWAIADYRVLEQDGRRQTAVCAHHVLWWPSLVTVLDEKWEPRGTFVNAGWVEQLRWIGADRLLVSGFSNPRDGGMVALLDTTALDGSSPLWHDPTFRCTSCGNGTPLRYVVFPRSELNRVTASRFNRVRIDVTADRIVARTVEVPVDTDDTFIDAVYELTPSLEVVRASFSDRYWDLHLALEKEGKLHHSRATCPERGGPQAVEVWDPAGGWRTIALGRTQEQEAAGGHRVRSRGRTRSWAKLIAHRRQQAIGKQDVEAFRVRRHERVFNPVVLTRGAAAQQPSSRPSRPASGRTVSF